MKRKPTTAKYFIDAIPINYIKSREDHLRDRYKSKMLAYLIPIFFRQMHFELRARSTTRPERISTSEAPRTDKALQPSLIFLNGFPGVGKYTIAHKPRRLFTHETRLIDNHLLIDSAEAI